MGPTVFLKKSDTCVRDWLLDTCYLFFFTTVLATGFGRAGEIQQSYVKQFLPSNTFWSYFGDQIEIHKASGNNTRQN